MSLRGPSLLRTSNELHHSSKVKIGDVQSRNRLNSIRIHAIEHLVPCDSLAFETVPCLLECSFNIGVELLVLDVPSPAFRKYHFMQLVQTRNQWLAVFSIVTVHHIKNIFRYLTSFRLRQFFGVCVVPLLILGNDPAFHLALLIQTIIVYADPEKHPEEGLQIVHEAMRLAKKRPDGHEDLGASLAWCTGSLIITCLVGKVEIDEETVIFVLCEHHVANRYITVEDPSIQ
jgi:hypothetical protein